MKIFIFSIFILSLLYLAFNSQLQSQFASPGSITWERLYDGPAPGNWYDGGYDVCEADSGNFYLAGYTRPTGMSSNRPWVIKINPYGDTIWTKIIGSNDRLAMACAPSPDGGCVITGDGSVTWTAKVDRDGNLNWLKTYPGFFTQAYSMIRTSDGGYAACGRTNFDSAIVFKIDSLGELEWMKVFGSNYTKRFREIKEIVNGFILVGTTTASPQDDTQACLTKVNSKGDIIWEKNYILIRGTGFGSVNILDEGYLIGGGTTDTVSLTTSKPFFMRTDTSGNTYFTKIFTYDSLQWFIRMDVINQNRYVIAQGITSGKGKAVIVDSLGNIINQKVFTAPSFIELRRVLPLSNGDIIFTGVGEFCEFDCEDVYAVRTDSILNYNPLSINSSYDILPSGFKLYPAYPNPFNPVTQLKFEIPQKGNIKIKIYDIAGRVVSEILNQDLLIDQHNIEWNASSQSSGVYFAVLYFENKLIQSQKMILIR